MNQKLGYLFRVIFFNRNIIMRDDKITRQVIEIIENNLLIETDIFIFNKISDNKSTFDAKK